MTPGHRCSLNIWCALIGIAAVGCFADQDDMAARLPTTAPELSKVSQAGETAPVKPVVVKPPDTPGVKTDGTLPAKPATGPANTPALGSWTVSLVASPPSQWAGNYTSLTATANMDVGPTQYFIKIWDDERGDYIGICGTGNICTINVTRTGPRATSFKAVIASGTTSVASAITSAYWHVSGVRLTESETTVAAGGPVLLTTFTDHDISTSPYWVQIHDDTTRTVLASCGYGITCSATVSQAAATTHRYRACFSSNSLTYPPPNILECTPQKFVTWTANPSMRVFLQPSRTLPNTITARSTLDVAPAHNVIQIFKLTGEKVMACPSGTICNVSGPIACEEIFVGFVGPNRATLAEIESSTLTTSRLFHAAQWTVPMEETADGPTTGAAVGPCPSPPPRAQ